MKLKTDNLGFTLIELIVVIVVTSIFVTMMVQFVYTSGVKSTAPIFVLGKSLKIDEILESITSDYLQNYTLDLNLLQTRIGKREGSDQNNGYGVYRVIHNRFIKFVANSEKVSPHGDSENGNLLKVTIESINSKERLTAIYYKQYNRL
jgi:prepilin-type N-terminal cleavage/methylation domain-containing protein